jgi:carboxyl-terminal processing protease
VVAVVLDAGPWQDDAMKRLLLGAIAFAGLCLGQVPGTRLAIETKVWVATKLYATIQMVYAHAEGAPEFDLDRDYQQYLKEAFVANDRRAFDLASMAFIGKLRNGHSGFYDSWLSKNYGQPLGFTLLPMAEGWVVIVSQVADLNPGDVVVSIGGKPMDRFFAESDALLEGSSEATRRRTFSWRAYLWPETFDLELASGKRVPIDRKNQKLDKPKTFPPGNMKTPEGIGYIRIRSFEDPEQEKSAVRQVKDLMGAKAILFDVRGNGGGSTPSQLIDALLDRPWHDFRFTTPLSIAHAAAQSQARKAFPLESDQYTKGYLDAYEEFKDAQILTPGPLHPAAPDAYKGKIFVLVDGFCNSACEDFVEPFKASGRGVLVGETTNGSSGQPYVFDFGNGMSFRVSSKRYYLPDGSPFEGVGIKPDVVVVPSLEDWKAGRDPVFAKAMQLASEN